MGVKRYRTRQGVFYEIDEWLTLPDGARRRLQKRKIPTKEQATVFLAKARAEAFEGRWFERTKEPPLTVRQAWDAYQPITKRDNDAWQTDGGRAVHLVQHLGDRRVAKLTQGDIDAYRTVRLGELTRLGRPPSPSTLDREVELLKRFINYAVKCGKLKANPIAQVKLLRKPNTRRMVVADEVFSALLDHAAEHLRPILLLLRDTAMRKDEVLALRHDQLDIKQGVIRLAPDDNKEEDHRAIYLTDRSVAALRAQPRHISSPYVFVNPATGGRWADIRKPFKAACEAAGVRHGRDVEGGITPHDLRRTAITEARRAGVPESVIMRMSGHKTRSVFKRYNIVEEDDLRDAVRRIMAHRVGEDQDEVGITVAETTKASPGNSR